MALDGNTLTQYDAAGALIALALVALVVIVLIERHQITKSERRRKRLGPPPGRQDKEK